MKSPQPLIRVAIGVLVEDHRILIARRGKNAEFAGLWEFPGGKCKPREHLRDCLKREFREELEIDVNVHEKIHTVRHPYPFGLIHLNAFRCSLRSGTPKRKSSSEIRWVAPSDLPSYPFPPANGPLLLQLEKGDFQNNAPD